MIAYAIGATLTAACAAGYQSMAPSGQWYGRTFTRLEGRPRKIALTYDDGPNGAYTQRLLEVLAKHDVNATFFLIGRYARQSPQVVREVAAAGHVIGNHTYSHPLLMFETVPQIRAQISECHQAITDAVGEYSNLFRPPFGARRPAVLRIVRSMGFEPVMWSVTGYDWNADSAEKIEQNVIRQVRGGDVILLHDGGHVEVGTDRSFSITATDRLIARYKSEGYEFVTIPGMMKEAALR